MILGIIGAMEEEIRLLRNAMEVEKEEKIKGHTYYVGRLGSQKLILVQSGIGKVNATITASVLGLHFQVDVIINTGTAGALAKGLKVGDLVLADALIHHDVDVTAFGYEMGQMAGMPARYYPDLTYLNGFKQVCRQHEIEPAVGLIVSGDQFVSDEQDKQTILRHFPKAKACEMESAAIAQTAHVMGIPFIIVRAISDSADQEASVSFDQFVLEAGKKSAQIVEDFARSLSY